MSASSSAMATPNPERDEQLLSIGKQCSHPTCGLVDFLPFKCQHCEDSFCQDHFMVTAHSCSKYDESKHNRIAPNCPFCSEPVAIRPGQDPNARLEDHFERECSVLTGQKVKKATPTCSQRKCGKILFAPIRCDKCRKDFCPSHRFPADHTCNPAPASANTTRSPASIQASSRLLALNTKASASHAASATVGAIKKTMSTSHSSQQAQSSASKPTVPMPNPFSKADRPSSRTSESYATATDAALTKLTTTTTITMITATPAATTHSIKPKPAIRSNSYVPPPIFGTA